MTFSDIPLAVKCVSGKKNPLTQMIRNLYMYHDHTLQTNPRHREEELQNKTKHKISGKQLSKATSSKDDCKTRKDTQHCIAKGE